MEEFYSTCWFTLKAAKPRLRKAMDEIELKVAGITIVKKDKKKKDEQIQAV